MRFAALLLAAASLSPAAAQDRCVALNGRIFALNTPGCIRIGSLANDGRRDIARSIWINGQSFGVPVALFLPEQTGNPNAPLEYGVTFEAAPGYRFVRYDVTGPITSRYIGQPGPPDWRGLCVNCTAFRIRGTGTITAVYDRIAAPPPPPVAGSFLGQDGVDCAGPQTAFPDGVVDLHIRIPPPAKPLRQVLIQGQGADRWFAPGAVCVFRTAAALDLYFTPSRSNVFVVTLTFTDNTTQTVNVR